MERDAVDKISGESAEYLYTVAVMSHGLSISATVQIFQAPADREPAVERFW